MQRLIRALAAIDPVILTAAAIVCAIFLAALKSAGVDDRTIAVITIPGAIVSLGLVMAPWLLKKARVRRLLHLRDRQYPRAVSDFRDALAVAAEGDTGVKGRAAQVLAHLRTLHSALDVTPRIEECTPWPYVHQLLAHKVWRGKPPDGWAEELERTAASIRASDIVNTPHALVFDEDILAPDHYRFVATRYAELCAILMMVDRDGQAEAVSIPRVLGAGGLLACSDPGQVVFLRRAAQKTMHPGKLHVFGGNFEPFLNLPGQSFDDDLPANAAREIKEESRFSKTDASGILVLAHTESADPEIQEDIAGDSDRWKRLMRNLPVHYCAIGVSADDLVKMTKVITPEGCPVAVPIDALEATLRDTKVWVPAGWYTTMLWLWMGAPTNATKELLAPEAGRAMAERILSQR